MELSIINFFSQLLQTLFIKLQILSKLWYHNLQRSKKWEIQISIKKLVQKCH